MKTITRYEAFDGKQFDTIDDCKAHEAQHVETRLVGLTPEQISAALDRSDVELADAIEAVAARITKRRYEMGDKRRARKADASKPAGQPTEEPEHQDSDLDPGYRGERDFKAGQPGVVPDDLKDDRDKAEAYLAGWDRASVAAAGQVTRSAA